MRAPEGIVHVNCTAYILAKNEEANIARCLHALKACGIPAIVLDSQSTDRTREIARDLGATVEDYRYTTHLDAYESICQQRTAPGECALVLDADMLVSPELLDEAFALLQTGVQVVRAPILMYWNGQQLPHGSLCPPKPLLFAGGQHYFEPVGHGERLRADVSAATTRHPLGHDDRKGFDAYLSSQIRYAKNLLQRADHQSLTLRDRLRMNTPVLLISVPLVSYLVRGGWRAGRAGLGYALDRLIAEAIMYRQSLAAQQPPEP
jgi:glycosyltransferase involved in cell wall biosynthesis